jgi:hypothetical protein
MYSMCQTKEVNQIIKYHHQNKISSTKLFTYKLYSLIHIQIFAPATDELLPLPISRFIIFLLLQLSFCYCHLYLYNFATAVAELLVLPISRFIILLLLLLSYCYCQFHVSYFCYCYC